MFSSNSESEAIPPTSPKTPRSPTSPRAQLVQQQMIESPPSLRQQQQQPQDTSVPLTPVSSSSPVVNNANNNTTTTTTPPQPSSSSPKTTSTTLDEKKHPQVSPMKELEHTRNDDDHHHPFVENHKINGGGTEGRNLNATESCDEAATEPLKQDSNDHHLVHSEMINSSSVEKDVAMNNTNNTFSSSNNDNKITPQPESTTEPSSSSSLESHHQGDNTSSSSVSTTTTTATTTTSTSTNDAVSVVTAVPQGLQQQEQDSSNPQQKPKVTVLAYTGPMTSLPPPPATPPPPLTEEEKKRHQKFLGVVATVLNDVNSQQAQQQQTQQSSSSSSPTAASASSSQQQQQSQPFPASSSHQKTEKTPIPINMQAMDPFSIEEIDQTQWTVLYNTNTLNNTHSKRILMRSSSIRLQQQSQRFNSSILAASSNNTNHVSSGALLEQLASASPTRAPSSEHHHNENKGLLVKNFFRFLSVGGEYLQKFKSKKSNSDVEEVVYFKYPHVRHCLQVFYKPFKILRYEAVPYRATPFKPQFAVLTPANSDAPQSVTSPNVTPENPPPQSSSNHNDQKKKKNSKDKNEKEEKKEEDNVVVDEDEILPSFAKILDIEKAQAEKATDVQAPTEPEELYKVTDQMGDFTEAGLSKKLKNALIGQGKRKSIFGGKTEKPKKEEKEAKESKESNKEGKEGKEGAPAEGGTPQLLSSLQTNQSLTEKEMKLALLQQKGQGEKKAVDAFDEIDISKSLKKSLVEKAKELCAKRPLELLNEITAEIQRSESTVNDSKKHQSESFLHVVQLNEENINKDNRRLMGVLQPKYEYKPLHTTLCQRIPEIEYPVKKKFRFLLSCNEFQFMEKFDVMKELFTFSVAIYDTKYSKKISEDYWFHLFSEEQLQQLAPSIRESIQKKSNGIVANSDKRLFSISSPNEEMYLVLYVHRVPTCSIKDTLKHHKKNDFSSEIEARKNKLSHFRHAAFVSFVPLFKGEKKLELNPSMHFDQFYVVEGDYKTPFNVYAAIKQKIKLQAVSASMKVHTELVSDLQRYVKNKIEDNTDTTPTGQLASIKSDEDSVNNTEEQSLSLQPTNPFLNGNNIDENGDPVFSAIDDEDEFSDDPPRLMSEDYGKTMFDEQLKILESEAINEIPWSKARHPHMTLFNTMYIYPMGAKLEKTKAKNVVVEVVFRENDAVIPTQEEIQKCHPVVINRFTSEKRRSDFTALEHDTTTPQFLDEIKIDVPAVTKKGNHLLFIFYHVDIEKKSSKLVYEPVGTREEEFGKCERSVLGYSFLELTEKNKLYEEDKAQRNCSYELTYSDVQRHIFVGELRVYKALQPEYLSKSKTKGILDKISDARFKLSAQLVSSVNPQDEVLQLFFASIHDLYSPEKENKEQILEYICRYVLMKFCTIEFSLFLPHLPIVMNILFELMSSISELPLQSADLRKGAERLLFEQVLVCLRGVYHYTKNHTRGNKFMASYIKYIFDEMNRGYPTYSVLTRIFTDYLEELTKILQGDPTKHYFETNNLSEHDPFRFSWFLFDTIIKSLTLCIKTDSLDCLTIRDSWYLNKSDKYSRNDEHPLSQEYFVNRVKDLMTYFCTRTKKLLSSSGHGRQNIGLNANRNLALFIRDLIPFVDRDYYIGIVKHYMDCLSIENSKDTSVEALLRLKSDFVAIMCDYDYFIPLNNLQLQDGNFLIRHFFDVFFSTVETNNEKLMLKVGKCVLDLFCKIDYDARYQDTSKRAAIAEMFLYFVDKYMDKEEYLTLFHNDEMYLVTAFCILWVLRNLSEQRLTQWWIQAPVHVMLNCISFLDYCVMSVHTLSYSSSIPREKRGNQRSLRMETILTVNYLISKLTEKSVLTEVFEKIKKKYDIDHLLKLAESESQELKNLPEVQILSKLEITRNTKTITPVESLILRSISRLIFNIIFQLTLKEEYKACKIIFQDCLHPLLFNFNHLFVCHELYDQTIPKKERAPYAQKRKVEQKWRWLLGVCTLYSEELMFDKNVGDIINISKECVSLLLKPFASTLSHEELAQDLPEEPEDVNIDAKRCSISSATFAKLVDKFVGLCTLPGDTEARGVFYAIFLNTFSSFTTARQLMNHLMGIYRRTLNVVKEATRAKEQGDPNAPEITKENAVCLYIEQAMNELVKEAFHALDNESLALYMHHYEEIVQGIKFRYEKPGAVKKVHPTLKKIKKTLLQNLLSFKKDEGSSTSNVHSRHNTTTAMIPRGIPVEKLKEPQISLNQWRINKKEYISKNILNPYNIQFDLLSWPATEIARQETIIDLKIFKKIEANEFYNSGWSDPKYKYELAPHISALTDRVNKISYWVQTKILTENNADIRKALFKKFVEIAKESYELNNYSAFFAIISGLQSVPVYRLKETRKGLSESDNNIFKIFDELHANNRSKLRENLNNTIINNNTPIIPFIGIFQTDLTFTSDGNPDEFNHPKTPQKKLINYQKRRIYYATIQKVKDLQNCANLYHLEPIPYVQYVLKEHIFEGIITNDDELHKKSLMIEPRKPTTNNNN
ncbi:hypothetical protein C9374_005870 [Naegleria lovaniensis]|uniref:C2 DOCK-type domain-containing protein n=1 Tax=Naegleria lovaniensis TaxID=51637 RepID=A0AA88GQ20_NAELO|nr:uncharacterized protein C9374_005870 [Naegleria lovaniensis]KAG2382078.1 hypothetical protein C9374_005870 [Naegleria lovaniensis]